MKGNGKAFVDNFADVLPYLAFIPSPQFSRKVMTQALYVLKREGESNFLKVPTWRAESDKFKGLPCGRR